MTQTLYAPVGLTPLLTSVPAIDRTNLKPVGNSSEVTSTGKIVRRDYTWTGGNARVPVDIKVEIRRSFTANGGYGSSTVTVEIVTRAIETDADGETVRNDKARAILSTTVPGLDCTYETDDYWSLLGAMITAFYSGVDGSNEPTTTILSSVAHQIPDIVG